MTILRSLIALITPAPAVAHDWLETEQGWHRVCLVCGAEHDLDPGSGFSGPAWLEEKRGDRSKHFPIIQESMHNGYSN